MNLIERLLLYYQKQQLKKYMPIGIRGTSASDDGYYPTLCKLAAEDDEYFEKFRRNKVYNKILEHVSYENGLEYLNEINRSGISIEEAQWEDFITNDRWGTPIKFKYEINGIKHSISPTTLRYIKVFTDIVRLFGKNNIQKVAEIGVGYGGQCRILTSGIKEVTEYTLCDLPEVLKLSSKYLSKFDNVPKINLFNGTFSDDMNGKDSKEEYPIDLLISNYAFTELSREIQEMYMEEIVKKSRCGYITWTSLSERDYKGLSKEEFISIIPNARVIEEKPLTSLDGCIVIWERE